MNAERLMDVVQTYGPRATSGLFGVSGMADTLGRTCPRELSVELVGVGLVKVGAAVVCCLASRLGLLDGEFCAESVAGLVDWEKFDKVAGLVD